MPDINTKVKLTGEAEYKQALNNVNASMKVLNSEMKLTTAQFAENGKSAEALKAKNDVLTRSIYSQEEKLKLMKDQLKKTADAYGEGSSKTMKLQAAVNSAETELVQMKTALKQNEQAIDEASDKSTGFGDALQKVADKLGIKIPDSARGATGALNKVKAGTAIAVAGFTALAKAIIDVEKKLINMTKESAKAADELLTLSSQTGLTTKQLQEFQYASDFVDVSMETLQSSLVKVTANMGKNNEAFAELGVQITNADGSLRSANDVFLDTIDALGKIENDTERDAKAMELFGKSAQDLNPLIEAGSQTLKELGQEAEDTGYVLDDMALKKLAAVDDAFAQLDKTKEAFQKSLSAEFAPFVTDAIKGLTDVINKMGDALVKSGAAQAFGSILESAKNLLQPLGDLLSKILPGLKKELHAVAMFVATIADAADVLFGLLNLDFSRVAKGLGIGKAGAYNNTQRTMNTAKGWEYDAISGTWRDPSVVTGSDLRARYNTWAANGGNGTYEYWDQVLGRPGNAAGTSNWRGGWSWVGENGPELAYLPRGSQVKSATESRESGGDVFNITIDAKNVREFNDIVKAAKSARMMARKGGATA